MKSIDCFELATEKAPDFAAAYCNLALSYNWFPVFTRYSPNEVYPKAKAAALKALELDNSLAEAHACLAESKMHYEWNWEGAEAEYKHAIELNPDSAFVRHGYAYFFAYRADFEAAIREMKRALELDPLSLIKNRHMGEILSYSGEYDQAIQALERTIEMDPNFPHAHYTLGQVYLAKSMYEEGIVEIEKERTVRKDWDPGADVFIAGTYAIMGEKAEARRVLHDLLERRQQTYISPILISGLHFCLGDKDQGFKWLDKAYDERDWMMLFLKISPVYGVLGVDSDPRYHAMLKKIGLEK
jgi:tetratricopeptide (TPR) repeat protein